MHLTPEQRETAMVLATHMDISLAEVERAVAAMRAAHILPARDGHYYLRATPFQLLAAAGLMAKHEQQHSVHIYPETSAQVVRHSPAAESGQWYRLEACPLCARKICHQIVVEGKNGAKTLVVHGKAAVTEARHESQKDERTEANGNNVEAIASERVPATVAGRSDPAV